MATITEARIEELLPMVDEYTGDDRTDCRILQDTARFEGLALSPEARKRHPATWTSL